LTGNSWKLNILKKNQLYITIKIVLSCLIVLSCISPSTAQDLDVASEPDIASEPDPYTLIKRISVDAKVLSADNLQNLYVITGDGNIIKYNENGKELARFNEFSLGIPTHLDATDPFQVLVFYPDFMTIVTLNTTLNKMGTYELFDLDINFANNLCFANDGNVWIYDGSTLELKKYSHQGEVLQSSQSLSFEFEETVNPNFLLQRSNTLFLNDSLMGVLVFDLYGQYRELIPIKGLTNFQVVDNRLIYPNDNTLVAIDLAVFSAEKIVLPALANPMTDLIQIEKSRLYVGGETELLIYKY